MALTPQVVEDWIEENVCADKDKSILNFKHLTVPFIAKTVLRQHVLERLNVLSMQ